MDNIFPALQKNKVKERGEIALRYQWKQGVFIKNLNKIRYEKT